MGRLVCAKAGKVGGRGRKMEDIRPGKNCGENERTFWKEMNKVGKGKKYQAGKREEKKWKNFN